MEQQQSQNDLEDVCGYQKKQVQVFEDEIESKAEFSYHGGEHLPEVTIEQEQWLGFEQASLDQTDDIMKDITVLAGGLAPLEIRELPDLTHGIGTWNVCNGFEAETIATLMLRCSLSILFIQEPRKEFKEIEIAYSRKTLISYGIKGYFTKHQYVLYNEKALSSRVTNFKTEMEGRLIKCDLQIGPATENTFLRLFGCYAIPQGDKKYKDGPTRHQKRRKLFDIIQRQ